ncbi:orange carotenoid protein N-terminal domain-containing protein [Baaleninema sp.]|uniref:orange carotenoid protein N-terminal domain-containing protein n=1 Tax=Baaleninema sp. TaxID=3101197 RepID=UPI003D062723
MAYATTANPALSVVDSAALVPAVAARFSRLSVDDQLALLWFVYTEMGKSITPAAPGAARLHLAEGLLEQIKAMQPEEQLQVMRDLAAKRNTPTSRAYGALSVNTKLAFWYRLAQWMDEGTVIGVPQGYRMSRPAQEILNVLVTKADFSQQISILRKAVIDMGIDPLS